MIVSVVDVTKGCRKILSSFCFCISAIFLYLQIEKGVAGQCTLRYNSL